MINSFQAFLTNDNIYYLANWGVIPFWLMILFIPGHALTNFLVNSIIAPLLLAAAYLFIAYSIYLEGNIFEGFNLYLGLDNLYALFSEETFLLIFWLHFLSISLFIGTWMGRDGQKYLIPKILMFFPIITTYFSGPLGLIFYWIIRIFFSKKINFND
tara:strand:+ start:127 stop:597 length:471 start_codon:yes stop_codon:yes gene_type:complete